MTLLTEVQREDLTDLFDIMINWMADKPDEAKLNIVEGDESVLIELTPAPEDAPHFIGKKGCMAASIRLILRTFSAKSKIKINFDIIDTKPRRSRSRRSPNGTRERSRT